MPSGGGKQNGGRLGLTVCRVEHEENVHMQARQLELFRDEAQEEVSGELLEKERKVQEALLSIRRKFGKNSILKGINYEEGATGRERNNQIGGHKA